MPRTSATSWRAHQLIWLEAALHLDTQERRQAFREIADLAGKSVKAVQMKAQHIQDQAKAELEWATQAHRRPLPIATGQAPTAFIWPSKATLRASNAKLTPSIAPEINHNA